MRKRPIKARRREQNGKGEPNATEPEPRQNKIKLQVRYANRVQKRYSERFCTGKGEPTKMQGKERFESDVKED